MCVGLCSEPRVASEMMHAATLGENHRMADWPMLRAANQKVVI